MKSNQPTYQRIETKCCGCGKPLTYNLSAEPGPLADLVIRLAELVVCDTCSPQRRPLPSAMAAGFVRSNPKP